MVKSAEKIKIIVILSDKTLKMYSIIRNHNNQTIIVPLI